MKVKLLILMFLTSFTTFSQYTIIPDSNFENKLIALGIDRDGKNGKVLTSSINNVKTLDVSFSKINDLIGIQDFLSLTTLACYANDISSLDLSKNIKLSSIDCRANKIKSLDVSNLTQLVGLQCSENFLTSLDVSKNPLVAGVFCSKNNLVSLNVKNGNNTNFQDFFCDFKNNPLLNCIQVDNPLYSNSKWASYKDATTIYSNSCGPSYTTILDSNFENKLITLGIDNDGLNGKVLTSNIIFLTELNISNSSITNLSGIENFINLETLDVSNNQLALLNIPTLKKIKNLNCSKNFLKQLDFSENKLLQTLNFSNNQVSSIDFGYQVLLETLMAGLNELTTIDISPFINLKKLEINDNKLTNLSLNNKNLLSFLNCSNNLLTSIDVSQNTALNSLFCGNNRLIKLDITANFLLKEITCENNLLTQLNLKNGKNSLFTNYDFRNNTSLKCIEVDNENYSNINWSTKKDPTTTYNVYCGSFTLIPDPNFEDKLITLGIDIDGKNGKVLTKSITNLTTLDLSNSLITDLSGIQDFVNLKTLDVSGNLLTKLDLSKNILLVVFNCSYNQIEGLDFVKNTKLIDLYCNNNNLNTLSLKNKNNTLIKNVDFRNNTNLTCIQVDSEAYSNQYWLNKKDIVASFSDLCGIVTLIPDSYFEEKLINLGIDVDGKNGKVLTSSIEELTTLNLKGNRIVDLTGIQDFKNLISLDCSNNGLTTLDISKNTRLEKLDCSDNLINNLDLSQSIFLNYLICSRNRLTSLDLTKNISLITLNISSNSLKNIDLVNNISLNDLNCYNTDLSSLDISKNNSLTKINCSFNKLISLNLSNNDNITHIYCSDNNITGLDVSNLAQLSLLDCSFNTISSIDLSRNTNLTSINCYRNKITELDVSKCGALINFEANQNYIVTINLKNGNNKNIPKLTFYDPYLQCIQVDNKEYSDKNWTISKPFVSAVFTENCNQYTLIPDPNFEDALIKLGIDKDGKNGEVKTIYISDIEFLNVSDSKISDLTGIQDFKKIEILSCSLNNINHIDVSQNIFLKRFYCNYNKISELDISKNKAIYDFDCSNNNLLNLNIANGNNGNFNNVANFHLNSNFNNNPNLQCIYVDNEKYANNYLLGCKDKTAIYSRSCGEYVEILDSNFENKLISLGIDKDGFNGKILKLDVIKVTDLDISSSNIIDVGPLEYFTSLKSLNCSGNLIVKLVTESNRLLTSLNCSNTRIEVLDFSKNILLTDLNCSNNIIKTLVVKNGTNSNVKNIDLKNNPNLTCIEVDDVNYSNLNWSNSKDTNSNYSSSCNCYTNIPNSNFEDKLIALKIDKDGRNNKVAISSVVSVTDLDLSHCLITNYTGIESFINLEYFKSENNSTEFNNHENINIYYNTITTLDISKNILLKRINLSSNNLIGLDISKNSMLQTIDCVNCKLTSLDVSKNNLLEYLLLDGNKLESLNLSNCTNLKIFQGYGNKLTYLNLKNGNNSKIDTRYTGFNTNPNLTCILVDNVVYSNANWKNFIDTPVTFSLNCGFPLVLPSDNFIIESKGETCLNQNNGEINISANATHAYIASVNNVNYSFTNNSLKVGNLAPGIYSVLITIPGEIFEQKFNITIPKGQTIAGKSSIVNNKIVIEIESGTAPYKAFVNGIEQFETTATVFDVVANKYDLVEILTAKACEGVYIKKATGVEGTILAYPNPTSGILEIELPISEKQVEISLSSTSGHLISNNSYSIENGKFKLSLENLPAGIYIVKIGLDTPEYLKIVKN